VEHTVSDAADAEIETQAGVLEYAYRPRAIGGAAVFRLAEHSLEWNLGAMVGRVAYPMITMVRLGFRPNNFGARRFIAEIWSSNGSKVEIASSSYRSLVATDDQGPAYRTFIEELHRRIAASGGECRFEAGFAAWRWWPMAAVGIFTAGALLYVAASTIRTADMTGGLLIAGFILLFAWQMTPLILRNFPRRYDPQHIPPDVMP
jgi:hypothetical protein